MIVVKMNCEKRIQNENPRNGSIFLFFFFLKIENRINSSMNKKINCKKEHCKFMTLETH